MPSIKSGLLLFLVLLSFPSVYAKYYSLNAASAYIFVKSDGVVSVTETINYQFTGTFREVFRTVYHPPEGSIENIEIRCDPQPCKARIDRISGGFELVGVLPQPTPEEITLIVSYDYYRGLKVYDDVSELHLKLWGEEWDKPLLVMQAAIELPPGSGKDIQYWLHPEAFTRTAKVNADTISIESKEVPSNSWYEIRAVFPRLENPDPKKVSMQIGSGMEKILEVEDEYRKKQEYVGGLYLIVWLLALISISVPFYMYYRFGREPEIDYHALYEREPPSQSKPAAVNAIMRGAIGKPDINAFVATIMDLVYRGFIDLKDVKSEKSYLGIFNRSYEDVILELKNKEGSEISDFELDVLNFLWAFSKEGKIIWNSFKTELGEDDRFYKFIIRWNKSIERQIKVERLFISTGNYLLMGFGISVLILTILGAVLAVNYYPPNEFPTVHRIIFPGALIFIAGMVSLLVSIINERGAGRFTPEGRVYYERWSRFRDYLTDFSALKEHPPESIKLWDFYMVYAVALGVAEKVIQNMARRLPKEELTKSTFYTIHHNPSFASGFNRAYQSSNPSSSSGGFGGGVGGVGGGFGGGGGGAR